MIKLHASIASFEINFLILEIFLRWKWETLHTLAICRLLKVRYVSRTTPRLPACGSGVIDSSITTTESSSGLARNFWCKDLQLRFILLRYRSYSRSLRSASQKLLVVHRTNMKTYGDRAFSIAGPKLWNQLPLSIRELSSVDSFKKSLKTYLFCLAYS